MTNMSSLPLAALAGPSGFIGDPRFGALLTPAPGTPAPRDPLVWVEIGRLRYAGGEQVQAIAASARALEIGPDNIRALEFRAQLLRDAQGRVLLLKRHGARFAARLLSGHRDSRLDRNFLTVSTGEKRFGTVTLDLGAEAGVWAASLRRLGER